LGAKMYQQGLLQQLHTRTMAPLVLTLLLFLIPYCHSANILRAVCTSSSPTIPNRVIMFVGTSTSNLAPLIPSDVQRFGYFSTFASVKYDSTISRACFHAGTASLSTSSATVANLLSHKTLTCSTALADSSGLSFTDSNSNFICYKKESSTSNMAIAETDSSAAGTGIAGHAYAAAPFAINHWVAFAVDGLTSSLMNGEAPWATGHVTSNSGFGACCAGVACFFNPRNLGPCIMGTPWNPGGTASNYAFDLGIARGGSPCVSPPSGAILNNVVADPGRAAFCTNAFDGFVCPIECVAGTVRIGSLRCENGQWSSTFKCVASASACAAPDGTSTIFFGVSDQPNGVFSSLSSPMCGMYSEIGAECRFTCTSGKWGLGKLKCKTDGAWEALHFQASCNSLATMGHTQSAPTLNSVTMVSATLLRIEFSSNEVSQQPAITSFEVSSTPALVFCPPLNANAIPANGYICQGSAADMYKYSIKVRSINAAGASDWSASFQLPCPVPQPPAHLANFSYDISGCSAVTSPGSCTVTCTPDGEPSAVLTCDGTWSGTWPECYRAEEICSQPTSVANAAPQSCLEGPTLWPGSNCSTACSPGYEPSVDKLECPPRPGATGVLEPQNFGCLPLSCSAPTGISLAAAPTCASGNTIASGTSCTAQCVFGYTPNVTALACSLGELSPPSFECNEAQCTAPSGSCQEGTVIESRSVCTTLCQSGYIPSVTSLSCSLGNLTPSSFACTERPCYLPPSSIPFVHPSGPCESAGLFTDTINPGGTCKTRCDEGYRPSVDVLTCALGNFSSSFTCEEESCSAPVIQNALSPSCALGSVILPGQSCDARCASGYSPSSTSLSCSRGNLTPSTFLCLEDPCPVPVGVSHAASPCGADTSIQHASSCITRCDVGYSPSVDLLNCSLGTLSPSTFTCSENPCAAPSGIHHAAAPSCAHGSSLSHSSQCITQCSSGYQPSVTQLSCSLGTLTPTSFTCDPVPCVSPSNVQHSNYPSCSNGASISHGSTCQTSCQEGYDESSGSLTCSYGTLTPSTFQCTESPCQAPSVSHASNPCGSQSSIAHDNVCTAQCNSGYSPSVANLTCFLGNLTPSSFTCSELPCQAPSSVAHSLAIACIEGSTVGHGTSCTPVCTTGYLPSENLLSCSLGSLSPTIFACIEQGCSVPSNIINGPDPCSGLQSSTIPPGTACQTMCDQGYLPSTGSLQCQAAVLTPPTFACLPKPCSAPTGIAHALVPLCGSTTIQHGGSCTTQCQLGYVPVPSSLSCSLGVLSNVGDFQCQPAACNAPDNVAHTLVPSCQSIYTPDSADCLPRCQQGYMPVPSSVHCSLGNFSDIFNCVEKPCSQPDNVPHSSVRCSNCSRSQPCISHGEVCSTQCDDGYVPSLPSLQCSLGSLTPLSFTCNPAPCSLSFSVAHAAAAPCSQGSVISHGGACTTQCMTGYEPTAASLNCDRGILTPSSFACSPISCSFPQTVAHVSFPPCTGGAVIPHGDTCHMQCQGLWKPVPTSLSCSLGVFSPSILRCEGDPCPPPDGIDKALSQPCADIGDDNITHGNSCRGQCEAGYEAIPSSLACNFGTLQPSAFECLEKGCSAPIGVQNAKSVACAQGTSVRHGQNCTAQCLVGFAPSVKNLTCSKGILPTFTCTPVNTDITLSVQLRVSDTSVFTEVAVSVAVKVRQALVKGIANSLTNVKLEWVFILRVYAATSSPSQGNSRRLSGNILVDFKIEVPHASIASGAVTQNNLQQSVQVSTTRTDMMRSINTQLTERSIPSEVLSTELKSVQSVEVNSQQTGCTAPFNIAHSTPQRCAEGASISHGGTCTPSCESGYYADPTALSCSSGQLQPSDFTCKRRDCDTPTGVAHSGPRLCLEGTTIPHLSTCTVVCASGYSPSNKSLNCSLGTLSPASTTCVYNVSNSTQPLAVPRNSHLQVSQDNTALVTVVVVVIAGAVFGLIGYATYKTARHGREMEKVEHGNKITYEDTQPNSKGPTVADEAWRQPLQPESELRAPHPQHLNEDMKAPPPPNWPTMSATESCSVCGNIFMDDSIYCRKCGSQRMRAGMEHTEGGGMLPPLPGIVEAHPDQMAYGMPYPGSHAGSRQHSFRSDYRGECYADPNLAHQAVGIRQPPPVSPQGGIGSEAPDDEEDDPDLFFFFFQHLADDELAGGGPKPEPEEIPAHDELDISEVLANAVNGKEGQVDAEPNAGGDHRSNPE